MIGVLMALCGCASHVVAQDSLYKKSVNIGLSIYHTGIDSLKLTSLNVGIASGASHLHGVQLNAFSSFALTDAHGIQVSGLSTVASDLRGMQISPFANISLTPFKGIQLGGISNISRGVKRGLQLSGLSNVSSSYMRGLQIGAYNYADTLNGSQLGVVNVCVAHPRGVQIGLINYSRDTIAHKIGLVNVNPKTRIDWLFFAGNSNKLNVALRFRNRSTYNIVGIGTHYLGLDEKFSGSLYYRIGQYFKLSPKWSVSGDVGYFHVETFQHNSADKPERLYSLQARLNVDWQPTSRISAFASLGYGDTRRYYHRERYRQRAIVELGMAIRYDKGQLLQGKKRSVMECEEASSDSSASLYAYNLPSYRVKHPWKAALGAFGINVLVNGFDRFVMNEDFAKINLHTIHQNFKTGFVWDNDQFSTNLFAHPYHGGLYFNSARSNGLSFWESAPYSFCGSLMWELACETEPPAINDLMATTIGGICIGEVTHRVSNLVFDDSSQGFRRFLREFAGTLICPIKGFNRLITGQAWRVRADHNKYHDYSRFPINFMVTLGDRYLSDEGGLFRGEQNPYLNFSLLYGDVFDTSNNAPYDYFTANVTFGLSGNQPLISSVHLLGKLWSANFYEGKQMTAAFGVFQHFNYYDSEAVKDGTQRVPYRISEAASIGPGLIYRFPAVGNVGSIEQRVFLDGILLGGSLSDYYHIIDRDYNMGSGYSAKVETLLDFPRFGRFSVLADYYRIYTWKGYETKDLTTTNPLYLNAQGDLSNAQLLVINPRLQVYLKKGVSLDLQAAYYMRETHYKHYSNVHSETFEVRMGLSCYF